MLEVSVHIGLAKKTLEMRILLADSPEGIVKVFSALWDTAMILKSHIDNAAAESRHRLFLFFSVSAQQVGSSTGFLAQFTGLQSIVFFHRARLAYPGWEW